MVNEEVSRRSWLPLLGLLLGLWAIAPPYLVVFGKLNVRSIVEFVDHAVPGIVVIAVAVFGFLQLRRAEPSKLLLFVGGGVISLAGFWMLATHVGLFSQTRQVIAPGGAVLWHVVPGLAVTGLGVVWTACFWDTEEAAEASSSP